MWKALSLVLSLSLLALPPAQAREPIGQIKTLEGTAHIERSSQRLPARIGAPVYADDVVHTGPEGALGITFVDDSRFSAGPETRVALEHFRFDSTTHEGEFRSRVDQGTLTVVSGKLVRQRPEAMTVRTPSAILGVRGTTFLVKVGARDRS